MLAKRVISEASEIIKLTSDNEWAYISRGEAYGRLGNSIAAIADYTSALTINPNNKKGLWLRGFQYVRLKQSKNVISDFTQLLEGRGRHSGAMYLLRGAAFLDLGKKREATSDFKSAIDTYTSSLKELRSDPFDKSVSYFDRGRVFFWIGRTREALEDFVEAQKLDKDYWNDVDKAFAIYLKDRKNKASIAILEKYKVLPIGRLEI